MLCGLLFYRLGSLTGFLALAPGALFYFARNPVVDALDVV